jgi:hypothetical protein
MDDATGYRGGSASSTRQAVEALITAQAAGDVDGMKAAAHDRMAYIDGVYGVTLGVDSAQALFESRPRPSFGVERRIRVLATDHTAVAEMAIDPSRPRAADFYRLVDGKVRVIERYWMLREIGFRPDENYAQDRHTRKVIFPI